MSRYIGLAYLLQKLFSVVTAPDGNLRVGQDYIFGVRVPSLMYSYRMTCFRVPRLHITQGLAPELPCQTVPNHYNI